MDMRRFCHILAFVTLLYALATRNLEARTRTELLSNEASSGSSYPEIDDYTAKWLWINCKVDLMDGKGTFDGLDLCHSQETICIMASNSGKQSLVRRNLRKAISFLPPRTKETLLDCIRKQNIASRASGNEDGYNSWYAEYLEYLFRWPDASRRSLADELSIIAAAAPAPIPGAPAPIYGPAPAPTYGPVPAPSTDPAAPSSEAPSNPSLAEPPTSPTVAGAPRPISTRYSRLSATPPDSGHVSESPRRTPSTSKKKKKKKKDKSNSVVVAVVATAGATFVLAALIFCCCCKCRKRSSSTGGPKDESPLLSISLNDYSGGSSHKSSTYGNSFSKEKFGNLSFSTSNQNGTASSIEVPGVIHNSSVPAAPLPPLKPPPGRAAPPPPSPPPPPTPPVTKPGPRPPPPPMAAAPPRPPQGFPPKSKVPKPSPLAPKPPGSTSGADAESDGDAPKTKLKPFFWDKVLANPDQSMVWHQIKSGSFQFDEDMIETLFGYNNGDKNQRKKDSMGDPSTQYIQIIDSKKAQNLSILLRALNLTTEEVCDALYEGNELPVELCQTLLKMAPTADEELKLRLYNGEISQLGPAERFLKVLITIPFAFKRLDSLCFMSCYQEDVSTVKDSLATLEVACKELRSSRLFLKLLEAVLKTGNRMNDGTFRGGAQAFKLDTLLKLADVKGTDGKTTLLQFVVQEIIRSEGVRAARVLRESQSISSVKSDDLFDESINEAEDHYRNLGLQVVSRLGGELENVKKASVIDADGLSGTVAKLGHGLSKNKDFLNSEMKSSEDESGFRRALESFVQDAEADVAWLLEEEKRIMALVRNTADYFHGSAKKDEGLRLFEIVRKFLSMLDRTCNEVKESAMKAMKTPRHKESPASSVPSSPDVHQRLFPAIMDRRIGGSSSSDDEDS